MAFTTKKSLLVKVRAGDEISWQEFYDTYKPLMILVGNDCGLTTDENDELVQTVMCEIFQKNILDKYDIDKVPDNVIFKYDPAKGRFRHYLKKIVRNHAIKLWYKRYKDVPIESVPEPVSNDEWDAIWNDEWQQHILNSALAELKLRIQLGNYAAFEMYVFQKMPVEEIADLLGISIGAVYTAKSRCLKMLKLIISKLEEK